MNKNFIVVFGSAVTGKYRSGHYLPSDIDVISDMSEQIVRELVRQWSIQKFHASLPIDLHRPERSAHILVPVLQEEEREERKGYIVLLGTPKIVTRIRDRGFASLLRMYGNNPEIFLRKLRVPQKLSLLPESEAYSGECGEDKYYSGLRAFRNAAAHVNNIDEIFSHLNCGSLLKMLLHQDADNWMASSDITSSPLPYGEGWSHGAIIHVSSQKYEPVLQGWNDDRLMVSEEDAINILFKKA